MNGGFPTIEEVVGDQGAQKCHGIIFAVFLWSQRLPQYNVALYKSTNVKRYGLLGTILDAAYHVNR